MEGQPNSEQQIQQEQQRFKTLGVRLDEGLHAQLSFIAQLTGNTLADEIRSSIEARVAAAQEDPDLIARAESVQAEMQREAEARRRAISGFFGHIAVDSVSNESDSTVRRTGSKAKLAEKERPGRNQPVRLHGKASPSPSRLSSLSANTTP